MLEYDWSAVIRNIATEIGYTPEQIGKLSLAQITGLTTESKQGAHMTAAQINTMAEKMRERKRGI